MTIEQSYKDFIKKMYSKQFFTDIFTYIFRTTFLKASMKDCYQFSKNAIKTFYIACTQNVIRFLKIEDTKLEI